MLRRRQLLRWHIKASGRAPGLRAIILAEVPTHAQATVLAGKAAHYSLLMAVPMALHGFGAVWPAMATYIATQVPVCRSIRLLAPRPINTRMLQRCIAARRSGQALLAQDVCCPCGAASSPHSHISMQGFRRAVSFVFAGCRAGGDVRGVA